jgi:geranylgeranyl pyrophosphate synthase
MEVEIIKNEIKKKGLRIDNEIKRFLPQKEIPNLYDAIRYSLYGKSKRFRSFFCLETCKALGGKEEQALPFAVACEMLHNWLLIHDDIQDGDTVRREKPAVWVKYGLGHAINIGDTLAHKVFEVILDSRKMGVDDKTVLRLVELMIRTAINTGEGQTMDMNLRCKNDFTESEYMETVMHKTAYYLACPIVGGAIIANADEEILRKIVEFSKNIGLSFQIRDDIIDLTRGKGRNEIGCDVKEGKRTLMVAYASSKCNEAEREKLFFILNKDRNEKTDADIIWVKNLFDRYDAINYAQHRAEELVEMAKESVSNVSESLRENLFLFADFMIERES